MTDETQAPLQPVNVTDLDPTVANVITALKGDVAKARTSINNYVAGFDRFLVTTISKARSILDTLELAETGETAPAVAHKDQVNDLLASLTAVQAIGLSGLPDALKAPVPGVPPAALPSLVEETTSDQVHVTEKDGVVVSDTAPEDTLLKAPDAAAPDTSNPTGAPPSPSTPTTPVVQPPNPEHQAPVAQEDPSSDGTHDEDNGSGTGDAGAGTGNDTPDATQ